MYQFGKSLGKVVVNTLLSGKTVGTLFQGTSSLMGDSYLMTIKGTSETKMGSIEKDNKIWYLTFESGKSGLEF